MDRMLNVVVCRKEKEVGFGVTERPKENQQEILNLLKNLDVRRLAPYFQTLCPEHQP